MRLIPDEYKWKKGQLTITRTLPPTSESMIHFIFTIAKPALAYSDADVISGFAKIIGFHQEKTY